MEKKDFKFNKILFITYGFISTMPILTFLGNTWFTWLTFFVVIYFLIKDIYNWNLGCKKTFYVFIFICAMISSFICMFSDMPAYWKSVQPKNMIWEVLYLIILLHLLKYDNDEGLYIVKGVYYAAIFQMLWGFFQYVSYSFAGIPINDVIFRDLLHMQTSTMTQYKGTSIALSGLCWNVGNMAPLIVIGYMLTKSLPLRLLFIFYTLISGSRTMLLGICACIGLQVVQIILERRNKISKKVVVLLGGIIVMAVAVVVAITPVRNMIIGKIGYLLQSFSGEFLSSQSSAILHARYWTSIPQLTEWSGLIHSLFGWGNGCSGYPFATVLNQYVGEQWVVESDFINRLWGLGYIGFISWYCWFGCYMMKSLKINKKYFILFFAILMEGVTYNVLFNWCTILMFVFIVMIKNKRDVFSELHQKSA